MSDFNPDVELRRLDEMSDGFTKVQRLYYFGELTGSSGGVRVAREAYARALLTYEKLTANHQTLAVPYAAQAGLGLAGLTHVEFRETPVRWESYASDSARRWELLAQARQEYNRVTTLGYARAALEALYLRAHLLEEWDTGRLDTLAEREEGVASVARGIRHLDAAVQMSRQAEQEYRRMIALADSLGLSHGAGDEDVSDWMGAARERLAELGTTRRNLVAREEALHAVYAERQSARWQERAAPLLWQRAGELAARDAGVADPFFDYYIQARLVNGAYRPFLFGPDGFYTSHCRALDSARAVRPEEWVNERLRWQRSEEWLDSDVSRRLAREGLARMHGAFAALDTMVARVSIVADSLPEQARTALTRLPPSPELRMPTIPDWGGRDPRLFGREEESEAVDQYLQYSQQIADVEAQIEAYRGAVLDYSRRVTELASGELPPELVRYSERATGLRAAQILLLDTLGTMVLDQVDRALEQSRAAAVWLPPGPQSVAAEQAVSDFTGAVPGELRTIAQLARAEAARYRKRADGLRGRPPALEIDGLAGRLDAFAVRIEAAAGRYPTVASGT